MNTAPHLADLSDADLAGDTLPTATPAQLGRPGDHPIAAKGRAIAARIEALKLALKKASMDYIAIGRDLAELKEELSCGIGADREGASYLRGGWQALCADYVGVSYKTADRYIADWEAYEELRAIAEQAPQGRSARLLAMVEAGEVRAAKALAAWEANQLDGENDIVIDPQAWAGLAERLRAALDHTVPSLRDVRRFEEMEAAALQGDTLAAANLASAAQGNVPMARAYAGWHGGEQTRGKTRNDPDYCKLMVRGAVTINRGWQRWFDLPVEQRRVAADTWLAIVADETMPEELARETYRALAHRFGETTTTTKGR